MRNYFHIFIFLDYLLPFSINFLTSFFPSFHLPFPFSFFPFVPFYSCALDPPAAAAGAALLCYKKKYVKLPPPLLAIVAMLTGLQASIQHYEYFVNRPHKYRRNGLTARRHNVVSAHLRLGYRPVWQVGGWRALLLCDAPKATTLQHYCLQRPLVTGTLPQGLSLVDTHTYLLLYNNNLDNVFVRHPHIGGCYQ